MFNFFWIVKQLPTFSDDQLQKKLSYIYINIISVYLQIYV